MEDDPTLGFKPEEAAQFIEALDQLGADFDTDATSGAEDQQFVIEEDDWHWLTKQAELAHLGVLDASHLSAIVGGVNDEQIAACAEHIAACAELTQFAAQLDDHGGSSSGDSTGKDWGHRGADAADGADADAEGDGDGDGDGRKKKVRDRGVAWSEEEHKLFLQGLDKFGKGDWRSISRQCVLTRTPAQVASHAQKYFIRQEGGGKEKPGKRVSIHDISSLEQSMPDRNQRKRRKQDRE
ncbi:DNA binding, partial [Chrysochromulina tobinii]